MNPMSDSAKQLGAALADAPDEAVGRAVAMLDGMSERGEADAVLERVRPRLRRLRPPRPLRLERLLMLPLEGALVAPSAWKGNPAEIPRNAIGPIAVTVRGALGPLAREIEAAASGHTTADAALVATLGQRLWLAAGAVTLPGLPPRWVESGLPAEMALPVFSLCGAVWRHAPVLWAARLAAEDDPPEPLVQAALVPLAAEGPAPLTVGMALLIRQAVTPALVAAVAVALLPAVGAVAERELDGALDDLAQAVLAATTPAAMAAAATRLDRALADLETHGAAAQRERQRRQAVLMRRGGAEACHARFTEALRGGLLGPVVQAAGGPPAADAEVTALEETARDLRRLEMAGRRLGREDAFDRARRDATQRLLALGAAPRGLRRVDVARLVEILAGTDAALPLLAGEV